MVLVGTLRNSETSASDAEEADAAPPPAADPPPDPPGPGPGPGTEACPSTAEMPSGPLLDGSMRSGAERPPARVTSGMSTTDAVAAKIRTMLAGELDPTETC
jgi:hypothetical protein